MSHLIVPAIPFDDGKSGISSYILSTLSKLSDKHELTVYTLAQDSAQIEKVLKGKYTLRKVPNYLGRPVLNMLWHLVVLPFLLVFEKGEGIFLPAGNRRVMSFYPKPTVVTVHDLSQFHVPAKYDIFRMFYIYKIVPYFLKRASRFLAISNSTKKDLIQYFHIPESKITLNYNGYEKDNFYPSVENNESMKVLNRYQITKPYLLYIARIEHPGKNHIQLIKAFEALPQSLQEQHQLVFAGSDWNGAEYVHQYVQQLGLEDKVRFLGFVPSDDLPHLYRSAQVYAFPSLYEGFGIPLVEAMASGTPVICSETSSLPEIGGDAVLTFSPENYSEISQVMSLVLKDSELRKKMSEKGLKQSRKFDWTRHIAVLDQQFNLLQAQ